MKRQLKTLNTFIGIDDKEIAKLFHLDDFELSMVYEENVSRKKINIGFTKDHRAFWISKYKNKYYGNMTEPYDFEKDVFLNLDVYLTMKQNAFDTLEELKHTK